MHAQFVERGGPEVFEHGLSPPEAGRSAVRVGVTAAAHEPLDGGRSGRRGARQ